MNFSRKGAKAQRKPQRRFGDRFPFSFAPLRLCARTVFAISISFAKPGAEPAYAAQMKALFRRHPNTTFIWAHIGVGRIIRPIKVQAAIVKCAVGRRRTLSKCFFVYSLCLLRSVAVNPETARHRNTHHGDTENAQRSMRAEVLI